MLPVTLGQELHSLGSIARLQESGAEGRRMDNSEGGSLSAAAGMKSEAPGSDDLLLDNEDPMLGKVGEMLYFRVCFVLYKN